MTDTASHRLPAPEKAAARVPRGPRRAAALEEALDLWPGLVVTVEGLDGPGYLVDLGQGRGEILLRRQDEPARRRYTLAHELAHWYLLHEERLPTAAYCRDEPTERWCEAFAAHLLMPDNLVLADLANIEPANWLHAIPSLARAYRVSRTAMRRRVNELGRIVQPDPLGAKELRPAPA